MVQFWPFLYLWVCRHSALLPRIDLCIKMTSLQLTWRWRTHRKINKKIQQTNKRANVKEKTAAVCELEEEGLQPLKPEQQTKVKNMCFIVWSNLCPYKPFSGIQSIQKHSVTCGLVLTHLLKMVQVLCRLTSLENVVSLSKN